MGSVVPSMTDAHYLECCQLSAVGGRTELKLCLVCGCLLSMGADEGREAYPPSFETSTKGQDICFCTDELVNVGEPLLSRRALFGVTGSFVVRGSLRKAPQQKQSRTTTLIIKIILQKQCFFLTSSESPN